MERLLFAWELGGGLGHIRRLLPIARRLRLAGFEPTFAFRDPASLAAPLREGFAGVPAPRLRPPPRRNVSPATWSDILLNQGFGDAPGLQGALRGWRSLLALLQPRLVVADYAPAAQWAAREAGLPCVTVGSGFALPPVADPMPVLRPWVAMPREALAAIDARLLESWRAASPKPPARLADTVDATAHLLCTFPELDPFGTREGVEYLGPQGDEDEGVEARWREPRAGPRIYAYLKRDDPRLPSLLRHIEQAAGDAIVVVPRLSAADVRGLDAGRVRLFGDAVPLAGLLEGADLCVSHGGPGIASRALVAGVAHAMVPQQLEQFLVAQRVAALGAGEVFPREAAEAELGAWLQRTASSAGLREAARQRAQAYRGFSFADASRRAAERIAAIARS